MGTPSYFSFGRFESIAVHTGSPTHTHSQNTCECSASLGDLVLTPALCLCTFNSDRKQTRSEVGTRNMACGCDRPCVFYALDCCFWEDCKSIWNFGLEKKLSVRSLVSCCGRSSDKKFERKAVEAQFVKFLAEIESPSNMLPRPFV